MQDGTKDKNPIFSREKMGFFYFEENDAIVTGCCMQTLE